MLLLFMAIADQSYLYSQLISDTTTPEHYGFGKYTAAV